MAVVSGAMLESEFSEFKIRNSQFFFFLERTFNHIFFGLTSTTRTEVAKCNQVQKYTVQYVRVRRFSSFLS